MHMEEPEEEEIDPLKNQNEELQMLTEPRTSSRPNIELFFLVFCYFFKLERIFMQVHTSMHIVIAILILQSD